MTHDPDTADRMAQHFERMNAKRRDDTRRTGNVIFWLAVVAVAVLATGLALWGVQ